MSLLDGVRWLPGGRDLVRHARAELPQKNELCGAFAVMVSLRAHGIGVADQDEAALVAGTVLLGDGPAGIPPGERGRADFRVALPVTRRPELAGTSAAGVARAVAKLSGGELAAVPACGDWTVPALRTLLGELGGLSRVAVIANVDTAAFAAQDTPPRALRDYLEAGLPPLWTSRWRVGHFVLLAGTLPGRLGTLVSVVDTYPSLGERGVHLQPIEFAVAALRREDLAPGGLLLVVPVAEAPAARAAVTAAGLRSELWDNGSPAPFS
ncbi:DUF6885 family protein [Qaidamihabitans albus]|uniref:DUF6885 family protein n=1 Tax=Qaidamihabitans albus TaxID=2795733 RepID=UPI0018F232CC|nr:hypothetical protein [Qaidamihabitans albus]